MNQRERLRQTVEAPNGARLVLPRGQDPLVWLFKFIYAELPPMPATTALFPALTTMRPTGDTVVFELRAGRR